MSAHWICIIPRDPTFVPSALAIERAESLLAELAPESAEISSEVSPTIELRDCGGNLETILCPACTKNLPIDWWADLMDVHRDNGFNLDPIILPCGHTANSLNDLRYHFDMGFSRFIVEAMDPNIGTLRESEIARFADILGGPVKIVYRHL